SYSTRPDRKSLPSRLYTSSASTRRTRKLQNRNIRKTENRIFQSL
ncbi:uncharacterized protein METZ01_LOCUS388401, partial [marine metagenome]